VSDTPRAVDPELVRLLVEELRRHEPALGPDAQVIAQRHALHALKGSASVAGERALAESLARLERRVLAGEEGALAEARARVAEAASALAGGCPVPSSVWPEPPDDLRAPPLDPELSSRYAAEMRDRLERFDRALASEDDEQALLAAYREVHAMKGAALAASDEATAWFCHGLEERLQADARNAEGARAPLGELTRWRSVLAGLIASPAGALEALRVLARPTRAPSVPPSWSGGASGSALPPPPRRPSIDPPSEAEPRSQATIDGATLRVPTATLDRLVERVRQLARARADVHDGAEIALLASARARSLRGGLVEALRLIGPPKPWGAPAAAIQRVEHAARELAFFAEQLERAGAGLKETADRVLAESAAAHDDLGAMRTTSAGWLFERVAAAAAAQARREGREVRITSSGEETALDRRVAEALFDPVLQLARNAITHGSEPDVERAIRGKPRAFTVHLSAELRSSALRVVVRDDGAGVNTADVRLRAVARGTIGEEMASTADDQTLLALLFVPGFTTKDSADLLAGRGVGLDLTLEAVSRLGGTIRLASQPGAGLTATIDVPKGSGLIKVMWVMAGGATYALPIDRVRRTARGCEPEARGALPLALCVSGQRSDREAHFAAPPSSRPQGGFAVALEPLDEKDALSWVGVDQVGAIEEVALRGVAALITTAGPYAGAIVRGSELCLCLDAHALVELVEAASPRHVVDAG
jgi:two-component system, chemotaxis family, sensor kinase CheA